MLRTTRRGPLKPATAVARSVAVREGIQSLSGRLRAAATAGLSAIWPLRRGMSGRERLWSLGRLLAILALISQVLVLLWVIWTQTGNVPFWDEWKMVALVEHAHSGTLSLADLWAFHNEHRPFLQRLIDIGLIDVTGWNRQIMMTFDVLVGMVSTTLVLSCVWTAFRSRNWWFALFVPTCLLMLSFGQSENWFWPWQLGFIGIGFGVVVCLRAVLSASGTPTGWGRFTLAILGALIATLSSAGGLITWIAFVPSIWRMGYRKLAIWMGSGIFVWVAYFIGFRRSFAETPSIKLLAEFALTYLGAPLGGHSIHLSEFFGALSIGLFIANVVLYFRLTRSLSPIVAWISLGLYGLGMAVITTDGRTALGIPAALAYRYQVFTALWWVAILITGALVVRQYAERAMEPGMPVFQQILRWPRKSQALVAVYALVLLIGCAGSLLTSYAGLRDGIAFQDHLRADQQCMVDSPTPPDSCIGIYDDLSERNLVLNALPYLRDHHLAMFNGK